MLIKGPGSPELCEKIDEKLDIDSVNVKSKVFPDGELYVKLEDDVKDQNCVLVQTTYPNRRLLELYMILDALWENGANAVSVVVPYYSYARQDKRFEDGEAISARSIAKRIEVDASEFYTIDIHSKDILDFFEIRSSNMSAMPALAEYSKKYDPDILISPDEGSVDRVKKAAEEIDMKWDYLEKTRIDSDNVEIKTKNLDVEGKSVVILDDIISTGGTMREAAKQLRDQGAAEIYAGCTHGLFVSEADKKLDKVCDEVFCTDTIETDKSEVSVADLIIDKVEWDYVL